MGKTQKCADLVADIIIVGGGVAGLCLARIMGGAGINVHLIEPYPPATLDETLENSATTGRTVALMQSSLNILKAAGMADFSAEHGTPLKIMRIYDDSAAELGQKPVISEFDSFDIGMEHFGMNIPNAYLRAALYEAVQNTPSITVHNVALCGYTVEGAGVRAHLDDERQIFASLIVGADGRNSAVRKAAHIGVKRKEYGQNALTFIINHSRAHDFVSTEFHRMGGPFALVPMQGNQCSVVWVEDTDKAEALLRLPKDAFENAVQKETHDLLGGVSLETSPQAWPLCAIRAKSLTAQRTALIAEAAHVMSPITAQGLNLSLRDVASLAEVLIDGARVGSDLGSLCILQRYARRRSFDVMTRTAGVDGLNQFIRLDIAPIKDLRRAGLKVMERFAPIKTIAMHVGLVPTFDQGRLARGEAL